MSNIALSSGVRNALYSIQSTSAESQIAQQRLATGKRVNSALDNPASFFTASGLSNRASDLTRLQDGIGQAVRTLEAADTGIKSISKLVEQGQGLARQALQTQDTATRATLSTQFTALRTQIDQLAKDSGYNGVNLLDGDTLNVVFNEDNTSSVAVTGVTNSSTGLAIAAPANAWAADADINAALTNMTAATNTLRAQASTFGSNLAVVKNRQDFTSSLIKTLKSGSDDLVIADVNEEAANLLALQNRQSLAQTSLSLANQAEQGVLRLF